MHAQILPTATTTATGTTKATTAATATAISLDGGKTKFADLQQLVDFHRMNPGALPCVLSSPPPS